jgi:predicted NUDIX family NTP pyrophosphohydrolase
MEWPPRSGQFQSFPLIAGKWFDPEIALLKVVKGQRQVLEFFSLTLWAVELPRSSLLRDRGCRAV